MWQVKMQSKSSLFKIVLILVLFALCVGACKPGGSSATSFLLVQCYLPQGRIDQGHSFDVRLTLENTSLYNSHVSEIRIPASFLENLSYLGSTPVLSLQNDSSGDGLLKMDLTIAPNGKEEVLLRFEALHSGTFTGLGVVVTDDSSYQYYLHAEISGVNPSGWQPGRSPDDLSTANLGSIPFEAVVQIKAVVEIDGERQVGWWGSGTIISRDGLILTNAHVVLSDRFYVVKDLIVALTVAQDAPPVDTYYASIVQVDANLDVAVIKPRTDMNGNNLDYQNLRLPMVPLGDSDALKLGDPLVIIGYPGIGGETVTLTSGVVSGFTSEEPYGNRAFIKTSATIAGGNSGGLAVNTAGELVGIPTQVGSGDVNEVVDCRALADTNRDGVIDDNDSCVPTGGFINALRPIKLTLPYVTAARAGQVAIDFSQPAEQNQQTEGSVVFEDDFSNPNSGWTISNDNKGSRGYENGEYFIQVDETMYWMWSDREIRYNNISIEADLRVANGVGDADFGFICGANDNGHYGLEISEDGYFTIWKQFNNNTTKLIDWTYSNLISANSPMHLAAICGTDGLYLTINEILLGSVVDRDYQPGDVGMIAGTFNTGGFKVVFDNLIIKAQ